jgi:nitroreductase
MAVNQPESCDLVFPCLAWAGYLKDWDGPSPDERPSAYIIILGDKNLGSNFDVDLGICAQTILIGAVESDLGGCMIASIRRDQVRSAFEIPDYLEILMVLAIGKPIEKIVIDTVKDGDIRYWRDAGQVHHVPKRELSDILIKSKML